MALCDAVSVGLSSCGHGTIAASSHLVSNHPSLQSISYSANVPAGHIDLEVRATRVSGTLAFEVGFPALDEVRWLDASAGSPLLAGLLGAVQRLDAEDVLGVARLGRYSVVALRVREDSDVLGMVTVDSVALVSLQESLPHHLRSSLWTCFPLSGPLTRVRRDSHRLDRPSFEWLSDALVLGLDGRTVFERPRRPVSSVLP